VVAFLKKPALAAALLGLAAASGSAQVLSPVYSFNTNDAVAQTQGLLLSGNTLYGTALASPSGGKVGGAAPSGSVFKLNTDGTGFTNLFIFGYAGSPYLVTNTDGATPRAGLVLSDNTLYGTTEEGGFYTEGIVFAINTDGTGFTNLHNFAATVEDPTGFYTNSDGADPWGGLVLSANTLYGATGNGGSFGVGTVFAIHTDGTGFTNLYNFGANGNKSNDTNSDGAGAKSSLILSNGIFYGTAAAGGSAGNGTVFAIHTDGTGFTNLHSFSTTFRGANSDIHGTNSDGSSPEDDLVLSGNKLYGTTPFGGTGSNGTVFALNIDGTGFTNLHSFTGSDGGDPIAGLVLSGGTLYGTASDGGSLGEGTVFALNTDGTGFATLNTFTHPTYDSPLNVYTNADGSLPVGNLILSGSTLYGATEAGGTNGIGTVFALNLAAAPPTIQFTASPTNGVPPLTVQFRSPTNDGGSNAILGWNWNFGDGATNSTAQNPSHVYTNAGTYFPTLACVNNNGDPVAGSGPAILAAYPTTALNGGFETGTFSNWTQSGSYYSSVTTGATYAHSGKYGAGLATDGTMGFLSQTLTTTPGAVYLISFWLDSPRKYNITNYFQVSWNGNVLLNKTNLAAIGWTNIQVTVTATATVSTLQFGYLNDYFDFGLDDVSVTPALAQLGIASLSLSGANLVINGINGVSNKTYYILTTTNLGQPLSQWTPVVTNQVNTNGNFTITATNAVDRNAPQRYYILESP
jgi:uncharacterized repeat protein (TIGR03803 family)